MTTYIGRYTLAFFTELGGVTLLATKIISNLRFLYRDRELFYEQALRLGYRSLPLVLLVGVFTGAVSAWQANYQFEGFIPVKYLGSAVFKAVIIELAPVLTGLIIAGRVSASIAAELGSMKVTEQIDALESLAINPVRYLIVPRFTATVVMMPVLVILAAFVAMAGGYIVSHFFIGLSAATFFAEIPRHFHLWDIFACLIKAFTFGAITSLMGCYIGINTEGGAEGVGNSTLNAFVWSSILILVFDYFLATLLF